MELSGDSNIITSPMQKGSRVYLGTYDGSFMALDKINGRITWSYILGYPIYASPPFLRIK